MEYVYPTSTEPARMVVCDDILRVVHEAEQMRKMCWKPNGIHKSAHAIAHPQVCRKPLNFFVTRMGRIVINPIIISKGGEIEMRSEGCMSFPKDHNHEVPRHTEIKVRYIVPVLIAGQYALD